MHGWYLGNFGSLEATPNLLLGTYGSNTSILSQNSLSVDAVNSGSYLEENTTGETLTYDAGSGPVTLQLEEMGYDNVRVLVNGWTVWQQAGLPVE